MRIELVFWGHSCRVWYMSDSANVHVHKGSISGIYIKYYTWIIIYKVLRKKFAILLSNAKNCKVLWYNGKYLASCSGEKSEKHELYFCRSWSSRIKLSQHSNSQSKNRNCLVREKLHLCTNIMHAQRSTHNDNAKPKSNRAHTILEPVTEKCK